jgi:hypothetical protein
MYLPLALLGHAALVLAHRMLRGHHCKFSLRFEGQVVRNRDPTSFVHCSPTQLKTHPQCLYLLPSVES